MEVFLQGLPPGLTDRSLRSNLQPFMERLSITAYGCSIHKKKVSGNIIFVTKSHGEKFLAHYGDPLSASKMGQLSKPNKSGKLPPTPSTLILMGSRIHCRRGNQKPSEFDLRNIHYETEKRESRAPRPETNSIALEPQELSCGHVTFPGGQGFTVVAEWTYRASYTAKFTKRNLILNLHNGKTEVRIPLQTINELIWDERGRIAVVLTSPPTFLRRPNTDNGLSSSFSRLSFQQRMENRQNVRLTAIDDAHSKISAFCAVYYMSVPGMAVGGFGRGGFLSEIERVRDEGVLHITRSSIDHELAGPGARFKPFPDCLKVLETRLSEYLQQGSLPFTMLFLLQALVYNHYLHPTVVGDLARKLAIDFSAAKKAGNSPPISIDAFKKLFYSIDFPSPNSDPSQFTVEKIMAYLRATEAAMIANIILRSTLSASQSLIPILRATVTPTRITFHGPDLEPRNRVLRKFPQHTDYFLRVQFCDESGSDLFFNANISLDNIYARFKSVLGAGIPVAGRRYTFLGFSHSSLRSHSAWLSAPFIYETEMHFAEKIIRGLGDFGKIKSPARRAARIGQAFSETPWSVPLDDCGITVRKIIDVSRNGRVFSDGVGTISQEAVEEVYSIIPAAKHDATAFQVRWAGAKGMLSLDTQLSGRVVCMRDSMIKFDSQDGAALEICDVASKPIRMVLNRSVVKILEDMGAPESWFMRVQSRELERLKLVTSEVTNTAAFLEAQSIGEAVKLGSFLRQLARLGFDYREDPFLRSAVEAVVLQELRLLKHKARIPVPLGMTLFGVMDETGFLKQGEVYVTYTLVGGRHVRPPGAGRLLVTRSPALHPGDIQLAMNVIPPTGHPLREQRNCIFFSQWGDRDLPSQLSGGDLDGDLFNVIWDPEVVTSVRTFQPADYPRVRPIEVGEEITSKHMADFFIDFMANDKLGPIANRHLILADQRDMGTLDGDCLKLAELHSCAVDFSKTGIRVDIKQLPKADNARPDFMAPGPWVKIQDKSEIEMDQFTVQGEEEGDDAEGPRHRFYKSEKILGKLYRRVDEQQIWAKDVKWSRRGQDRDFWNRLKTGLQSSASSVGVAYLDWWGKRADAEQLRLTYEDAVSDLMCRWSDHPARPLTELEVFLGFILNKTGSQTHRQRDYSIKLKDEFERVATTITRQLRSASREHPSPQSTAETLALCLAAVHVGCDANFKRDHSWRHQEVAGMQSFRVVAAAAFVREWNTISIVQQGGGFLGTRSGVAQGLGRGGGRIGAQSGMGRSGVDSLVGS